MLLVEGDGDAKDGDVTVGCLLGNGGGGASDFLSARDNKSMPKLPLLLEFLLLLVFMNVCDFAGGVPAVVASGVAVVVEAPKSKSIKLPLLLLLLILVLLPSPLMVLALLGGLEGTPL